ncbi:MAG TPA: MmcB family DNA repair protein [Stellaceae bacterium]|nr:MmcB family DNA repair protein [Stellaceae bacterium]
MPFPEPGLAQLLARGVSRGFLRRGHATLIEFSLANGRRADVAALGPAGDLSIVEIKTSVEDFRADRKWPEYREFCDQLYFAVPDGFPVELIPAECGLIAADPFMAEILREAPVIRLNPARRKAVTLRFALAASTRLQRLVDPHAQEA